MALKSFLIDTSQSEVSFSVKKLGFLNIKGTIGELQGEIVFDEYNLGSSSCKGSVKTDTINTGNLKRDEHLKGENFFSVDRYPKISFKSDNFFKEKDQFLTNGGLSILNIAQKISIPFSVDNYLLKAGFSINRLDYNLGKRFAAFIIGKTVQISIVLNLIEQ